jgi:hypothetical protein
MAKLPGRSPQPPGRTEMGPAGAKDRLGENRLGWFTLLGMAR